MYSGKENVKWIGKSVLCFLAGILAIPLLIILFFLISYVAVNNGVIYETNYIEDYGDYSGNHESDEPEVFITSFFPKKIEDYFTDITYHFVSHSIDAYAYEAYLEFMIEDREAFLAYLPTVVDLSEAVPFVFDDSYMDYTIDDALDLKIHSPKVRTCSIGYARYGKILYSMEEQRIIFVAIGMLDGGGADTVNLGHFFTRFNIDPRECARTIN